MASIQKWMEQRRQKDEELYEKYGKTLERTHKGSFVAIGPDGQTILGKDSTKVLQKAIVAFGSGNFALTRLGYRTFGQWLLIK